MNIEQIYSRFSTKKEVNAFLLGRREGFVEGLITGIFFGVGLFALLATYKGWKL